MRLGHVATVCLSWTLIASTQMPMPADGGAPVFSDRVPADSESMACLTESLVIAGFAIDEGHTPTDITWRRAGSPGFGGELVATYIVRAMIEADHPEWLDVRVSSSRPQAVPSAGPPMGDGPARPGVGRSRDPVRPKVQRDQERTVIRAELEPVVKRCAGQMADEPAARDTIDVLFLGNSYTYYNNLPRLLEGISEALDGPVLRATQHTHGGFSLNRHLSDGHVPQVFDDPAVDGEPWERIILQEQSRLGTTYADSLTGALGDPDSFHDATRTLVDLVRERGSAPVLYMTWAKERFPSQSPALARAYDRIGQELQVPVAPAGLAWARVVRERPDVDLFLDDGSHPTPAGSYLVACVIYAQLTGRSPEGAPLTIEGLPWETPGRVASQEPTALVTLDSELAAYLQRVAWATVRARLE